MRRAAIPALAGALAVLLTACSPGLTIFSNYRSLENLELVRTVTADTAREGVHVTICSTAGEKSDARMYGRVGPSIGVALGELIHLPLGREAILSHTENLLIGEAYVKEGLAQCLDYMERFSEMRLDTGILIVRGGTAKDLVEGLTGGETPAPDAIAGLGRIAARIGRGYFFTCRQIAASLAENGCALAMSVRGEKADKLFEDRGELDIEPAGFAVLRPGEDPVFLSDEETWGALMLLGLFRSRNVDLPVEDTVLTVSVDKAGAAYTPRFDGQGLAGVDIALTAQANVICMEGDGDLKDPAYREKAEKALGEALRQAAGAALDRSRVLQVDFLDLAGIVRRKAPLKFEGVADKWGEIFPELPLTVTVKAELTRTFDIVDPPAVSKGEEAKSPWEKLTDSLRDS